MNKIVFLLACVCNFIGHSLYSITQEELLEYAIGQNDKKLLEAVFRYPGSQDNPSLNLAMDASDYFAVFMFVEYGVDINSRRERLGENLPKNQIRIGNGRTVLESAIVREEIALVEYFLLNGADPTIKRHFQESVQGGAAKANYATTAVYDAIVQNRLDVIVLFLDNGVDFNRICHEVEYLSNKTISKMTPIQVAVSHNRKEIVAFFLSIGIGI